MSSDGLRFVVSLGIARLKNEGSFEQVSGGVFPLKSLIVSEWKQALDPKEGNVCFSSSQIPRVVVLN